MNYTSKQLLKPVMSVSEHNIEVGVVSNIIIDGTNKKVIALGLLRKCYFAAEELKIIPFKKIVCINDNSVMIMSSKDIISYKNFEPDIIEEILKEQISIIDTDYIKDGKKVGTVKDYAINEKGDIVSCKVVYEKEIEIEKIDILAKSYTSRKKDIDNTSSDSIKSEPANAQHTGSAKNQTSVSAKSVMTSTKKVGENMNYRLYLNKTLKKDLICNGKTYSSGTNVTKEIIDALVAANKVSLLGEYVNF